VRSVLRYYKYDVRAVRRVELDVEHSPAGKNVGTEDPLPDLWICSQEQ
jgi:hypothetical protein